MSADKVSLRKRYADRRRGVLPEQRQLASQAVADCLTQLPEYQTGHNIALFSATPDEIDLSPFWECCRSDGKQCFFPHVTGQDMAFYQVLQPAELTRGAFGILEPSVKAPRLNPGRCDLIIVPGVAFDRQGGRLGLGKGFYDRYLPQVSGCRVGVCVDECLIDQVPCEPHDVRMHMVVTESGVIRI
ncbi:MAG: 5-formyltetrahydrofolate cyclo-ligase [Deltaproteobacteria bacterium CG11_big_fil_rev_8_21_14_0_20_47_16]|nr:MAG: 5-formyltetrahydrofolate cyclo-ligase [Deltaproteobacteria bacterium CG11_big_fil_rev_8_21_14_0_20_47_16]